MVPAISLLLLLPLFTVAFMRSASGSVVRMNE
jgi:hypothetical protein